MLLKLRLKFGEQVEVQLYQLTVQVLEVAVAVLIPKLPLQMSVLAKFLIIEWGQVQQLMEEILL